MARLTLMLILLTAHAVAERVGDAGIYQCRDGRGALVYQDRPCRGELVDSLTLMPNQDAWQVDTRSCRMLSNWLPLKTLPPPELAAQEPILLTQVRLEIEATEDGVVVQIKGFEPPSDPPLRFTAALSGQGVATEDGLIEVDSLDASDRLRYGFSKSRKLIKALGEQKATLELELERYGSLSTPLPPDGFAVSLAALRRCFDPDSKRSRPGR